MMEVVRKIMDASNLLSIMSLPEAFHNRKLEIIILPTEEEAPAKSANNVQNIVQSLIGAIPQSDLSLEELREERLKKYEAFD